MKKDLERARNIFFRYVFLILVALPNLWIFYFIFTPLTVYPVYFLLKSVYPNIFLNGNILVINRNIAIEIVRACVAGSAYYLLLILNFSLPKINLKQRTKMIAFSFLFLLIVNILRIFVLSIIAVNGLSFFGITHEVFWYSLSTIFVVAIWFLQVKYFKIKELPFYSDIKFLYRKSVFKR